MGRRTSLVSLAGEKVEDVPGRSDAVLLSVPLEKLHCTRFNPRRNFGTEEDLRDFGEKLKKEQLQPAVVVSRSGYLKLWPDEADRVGLAAYVIANGERRYRASQLVGRPVLEVVHREDVAKSRADFLDAVQSENNDRKDLDPIERAIAIETMVTELGGADQVAVYYDKTKGWVSQQRKLLKLAPHLQDLVSSGEMPVRIGRDIAGLPADVQVTAWEEAVARRLAAKETPRRRADTERTSVETRMAKAYESPAPAPERFTAVNQSPVGPSTTAPAARKEPERFTAVNRDAEAVPQQPAPAPPDQRVLPEARTPQEPALVGDPATLPRLPYEDGNFVAHHLIRKMPPEELMVVRRLLNQHATENGLEDASAAAS
jgi:ParB family chromosome partitioning protein